MFVALARHLGCEVIVVGRGENRIARASRLGASRVIDAATKDWTVSDAASPGPDVVIEAVGKPETWEASVRLVRPGGMVNFFGGCPAGTSVSLDTSRLHYSSISTVASFHHTPRTIRRALEFIEQGVIRAEDFVDGACSLRDLPILLQQMAAGNRTVKTLVNPRG
jgi:L-iditol 2-dehydrogenase